MLTLSLSLSLCCCSSLLSSLFLVISRSINASSSSISGLELWELCKSCTRVTPFLGPSRQKDFVRVQSSPCLSGERPRVRRPQGQGAVFSFRLLSRHLAPCQDRLHARGDHSCGLLPTQRFPSCDPSRVAAAQNGQCHSMVFVVYCCLLIA